MTYPLAFKSTRFAPGRARASTASSTIRPGRPARWRSDSQVESDAFQVEVNERFPVFYSEKRPFFMEGAGLFSLATTNTGDNGLRRAVHPQLVAFSCKGRGFCPSCGGRRMAERAAHLIDHVFPDVPVRQWVLSLPHRLRYQLAWDHDLCRAVVAVFMQAVLGWLRRRARNSGTDDGRGGAVAVIQRFGGALNLNVRQRYLA